MRENQHLLMACTSCGVEYPRTRQYFPIKQGSADGLDRHCKDCKAIYHAGYIKQTAVVSVKVKRLLPGACSVCDKPMTRPRQGAWLCERHGFTFYCGHCSRCKYEKSCKQLVAIRYPVVCERWDQGDVMRLMTGEG